jgi:hypothetical protein
MSRASRAIDARASAAARGLGALVLLALTACGRQDGVVGSEPLATTPDSGAPDSGPKVLTYRTDFDVPSDWLPHNGLPGASIDFGVPITGATDPSTAELRFPGHPEYAATQNAGADYKNLTQIESPQTFGFGTYRTHVQFGGCQASEDAVNAALGYFDDGTDLDQDGITDHLEIDFQVLCGTPRELFLTVFTEFDATQFRKLSHVIDFSTGDVSDTPSAQSDAFTKTNTDPSLVHPELFAADTFYEVGFEWHSTSLRFFMLIGGTERTLWTLTDSAHIPQHPVSFLYNLWHPAAHWYPATTPAAFPANDVVMHIDWFEYYAE